MNKTNYKCFLVILLFLGFEWSCYASSLQTFDKITQKQTALHEENENVRHKRDASDLTDRCSLPVNYQQKMNKDSSVVSFLFRK